MKNENKNKKQLDDLEKRRIEFEKKLETRKQYTPKREPKKYYIRAIRNF